MPTSTRSQDPIFPTFVVGSLPRPQWLRDVVYDLRDGKIDDLAANACFDSAIPAAIRMQERAGLDYVSDGEWRRESYIKVFSENVHGFQKDAMPSLVDGPSDPAVAARLSPKGSLAGDATRFLSAHTDRKAFVTLPSPYMLGWRMWSPEISSGAYATREEFMLACAEILRAEIATLVEAGADHVQIDEPWLLMLVDPAHRERMGMTDMEAEIELAVRMINLVVEGYADIATSVHLCHGHFRRQRYAEGGYEPIIDALGEINVDRFAMEFAAPESHGAESLAHFPANKILGLGVIDQVEPEIETPEQIIVRVEAALRHVPAERMTLNPDCGFSPSSQNPMDIDEAYLKLSAMCRAAEILRNS